MTEKRIEEFYELSGRFLADGYSVEDADKAAIKMMLDLYPMMSIGEFAEIIRRGEAQQI